ncbi:MAG TPA: bifunctional diguanylate cyclase/phosphodiesterase [Candidatus Dormibacteraeota bacterium]|nr:bifunctional diguanylate cyclase/phosphodiesterase [Candidatus Dormibacteraeota bacterium]
MGREFGALWSRPASTPDSDAAATAGIPDAATLRIHDALLVARVRWAAVAMGAVLAFLVQSPRPVGGALPMLAASAAMGAYNVAIVRVGHLPRRVRGPLVAASLGADLAVVAAWTLLTSNDEFSTTYAAFGLVAIEAATLYRWAGTAAFAAGFACAEVAHYWVRYAAFGFGPQVGSIAFRAGIVLLAAVLMGAIAAESERRRREVARAGERYARLHREADVQAELFQQLLQSVSDVGEGILVTEAGRFVDSNAAYRDLTGYTDEELRALPSLIDLAPEPRREELKHRLADRLAGEGTPISYESQLVTKEGAVRDVEAAVRRLTDGTGTRLIAIVRDVTEQRRALTALAESERRAIQASRTDPLTGVANRRAWDEELARAMAAAQRLDEPLTVALLDLDGFKGFNDDWGHQRGDDLLREFASRWREALRASDLLARIGGDEFAVLLQGITAGEARAVAERLRSEMSGQQAFSVGIATWDGEEAALELLSRADAALYESKRRNGGRVVGVASAGTFEDWAARVRQVIAGAGVQASYQPIRRLDDRSIVGYEALARPAGLGGLDSVEELFRAAKRLGHTRDLDWICRRAALGSPALPPGTLLFVNVSAHALLDPLHDVDQMELLLQWARRDPGDVVLEISERDPVMNVRRLESVLQAYRAAGFRFAIDDIGEGHSTLEVLVSAVPEFVKVARSLTVGALKLGAEAAVSALVQFCATSGTQLIAEGLESDLHVRLMRDLGVELGQGYALGVPELGDTTSAMRRIEPVA